MSCKKELTGIGSELLPNQGIMDVTTVTIPDVIARTIAEDSLRTDSLSTNILGAINDPYFGTSSASLICQPIIPEPGYDFTGSVLDSVVLTLKYHRVQLQSGIEQILTYGNIEDEIEIEVYRLAENLESNKRYYSNSNIATGDLIGSFSGKFRFLDSVEVRELGDTFMTSPQLQIRLSDAFGTEMLSQDPSVYASKESFLEYLKGLVLVPKMNLASGKGAFVGIQVHHSESALKLYYDGDQSKKFLLSGERIGLYTIGNQTADIVNQKNGSGHYNTGYVQSLAGAKIKIDIPGLKSIIESDQKIVINRARIRFKIKAGTADEKFKAPHRLLLLRPDPVTGANAVFIDFIDNINPPNSLWIPYTNYGGEYDDGEYTFHFNRYLQELVDEYLSSGINKFDGFYLLMPSDFPIIPARAVIDTDLSGKGIEVSVSYSKLN